MNPLTADAIRASLINTSKRERTQATLPDLDIIRWDRLDLLGWIDPKRPQLAYVVLEHEGTPTGIMLRTNEPSARRRRKAVCSWCEDVIETDDVSMYVARRAGAPGRRGDSIGTLICTDFRCSRNVRRQPTESEVFSNDEDDKEMYRQLRIAGLQERSSRFVNRVLGASG
ncbi:FBP domain-containing protein [Demetria terragena]|uniref:FBP domain-containing protein n=1 Tax=Demetria terragena TaxID=63959 RepID=UPI000364A124|nr:FBP domain-containing protein [Demetria terragena]